MEKPYRLPAEMSCGAPSHASRSAQQRAGMIKRVRRLRVARLTGLIGLIVAVAVLPMGGAQGQERRASGEVPTFRYDPTWPKQLPNNWITGNIGALFVDASDHVWIVQRPSSTTGLAERYGLSGDAECCFPAPPVMEFDTEGNLLQAWGPIHDGTAELLGEQEPPPYPMEAWPTSEHGLFVDHEGNVWVDSQSAPSQLVKLTRDGTKLLLRIGRQEATSSHDTENLAGPTGIVVDPESNEVFVADGYRNRRVIVFDATTGAYKRHWGAYGKPPSDPQAPSTSEVLADRARGLGAKYAPEIRRQQFDHVHCLVEGNDGLLYVCDRANNRIQVFRKDGTFVKEGFVAPNTLGFGSLLAIAFSHDAEQRFMYVADGPNHKVWILQREDLSTVGSFGAGGRGGGQFVLPHAIGVDSQGNVYVGETVDGNRVQKFEFTGLQ